MNRNPFVLRGLLVVAPAFLVFAGCSGEPMATVSGKVMFLNKALPGGSLQFVTEDRTRSDIVPIKADGTYSTSRIPYGNFLVGVMPAPKSAAEYIPGSKKDPKPPKDSPGAENYNKKTDGTAYVDIPKRYYDPGSSRLSLTVDKSEVTYDITINNK
jgi:hypothetical protein